MATQLTPPVRANSGMLSERTRMRMVERLRQAGVRDERVLTAMFEVQRHLFIDEAIATRAYDDVALPIGHGQTISQPYMVARMTELILQGRPPGKVLEIGTGCGYQTAILAKTGAEVYSVERLGALLDKARRNLRAAKLVHARLVHGDGHFGLPEAAPFDGIIMTAAAHHVPEVLLTQLAPGGRLVMPLGGSEQYLWLMENTANGIQKTRLDPVRFVPLLPGKN